MLSSTPCISGCLPEIETIVNAELSLENVCDIDRLTITFIKNTQEFSKFCFELKPQNSVFGNTWKIADIYPLNKDKVSQKFDIKKYLKDEYCREIKKSIDKINDLEFNADFLRIMVIDFKDQEGLYNNHDQICKAEQDFANFFKDSPPKNKETARLRRYELIKNNSINFFINEGTLKADLLTRTFKLGSPERDFLVKNGLLFCQLCEIIMNGFKQGREAIVDGVPYTPKAYISVLKDAQNAKAGSVNPGEPILLTYYPNFYRETYSKESLYFKTISKRYNTEHNEDENGITTITIQ